MSDIARVAGKTSQTIELGGKQYTLRPYTVGIWAEASAFVRKQKGDPIKEVCERLSTIPPEYHAAFMRVAVESASNQTPSDAEMAEFGQTLLGRAFMLWTALKADHLKEFPTPFTVLDVLVELSEQAAEAKLAEIAAKLELASGMHDLKNSNGQSAADQAPLTENQSTAAGQPSTASSSANAAGL